MIATIAGYFFPDLESNCTPDNLVLVSSDSSFSTKMTPVYVVVSRRVRPPDAETEQ